MLYQYILYKYLLFFGALLLVDMVISQQTPPKSTVTMTLSEFEELFASAKLEDAQRRILDQRKMNDAEHKRRIGEIEKKMAELNSGTVSMQKEIFPENYQVLRHQLFGNYNSSSSMAGIERDVASFNVELILRVMDPKWTIVPISNSTSIDASSWVVKWRSDNEEDEFQLIDTIMDAGTMLLFRNDQQVLATNRSGLFHLTYTSYVRISKTKNLHSLRMSNLLYPLSAFSLRVATSNSNRISDLSVQPASAVLQLQSSIQYNDINVTLPSASDSIQIKWLEMEHDKSDDHHSPRKSGESNHSKVDTQTIVDTPQVAVINEVLHTIGDGIMRSKHILELTSSTEISSLNSVQFVVLGNETRITSVSGHALQSWTVEEDKDHSSSSSLIVRATFKKSYIDPTVTLLVQTEVEIGSYGAEKVELTRIVCNNAIRQTGHVAVIKDANVEVHENKKTGLSRCDASEVSSQLRLNCDRPIVMSYKFLNPKYGITLDVKNHATIDVLESTIDRLHYKVQVMEKHNMHSMIFILQNTKLQYLKLLRLPSTSSMFTVMVNSIATKPVRDDSDENSILIPLLIGLNPETANEGARLKTSVELSYISEHDTLDKKNGTLEFAPPHLDLPISVMTVHIRLPDAYAYNFTGSFGEKSSNKIEYPIPSAFTYKTGRRVVPEGYEFSGVDDVWPEDIELSSKSKSKESTTGGGAVKILTPRTGTSYYFYRLLVVDTILSLNATYYEPPTEVDKSQNSLFMEWTNALKERFMYY